MAAKSKVSDTFQRSSCFLCGFSGVSQFFNINESFIEYFPASYISFREILNETLELKDIGLKLKTEEICLDCKDKAVKFYYFKRKVREVQNCKKMNKSPNEMKRIRDTKSNKAVLSINQVLEEHKDYSIVFIKIDEQNRKINIELKPNVSQNDPESENEQAQESFDDIPFDPSSIKHENLFCDSLSYADEAFNEQNESDHEDTAFINLEPATKEYKIKPKEATKSKLTITERKSKPKAAEVYPHRLKVLPVDIEDSIALYDPKTAKFSVKYRDIIRRLLFAHFNIRVTIISSFVGKTKTNITLRCERCKQGYKLYGFSHDLVAKIKTRFTVSSQKDTFCKCFDPENLLVEQKHKGKRR